MNQHRPNDPTSTNPDDTAWEEAMSRDFDARVRDLHEAPLDISSVKGKAHKIKRNRRAAVAGGILGVAAIVTPIAVLANGDGDARSREPDFAPQASETVVDPAAAIDYVLDGAWHQADGEVVQLPENANPYDAAVLWNDQLVATRWDGEVFSIADVIDDEGNVVDTFETTAGVVVNEAATTISWVGTDGTVMTGWDGGKLSMGTVDLAAAGETVAYSTAGIIGGSSCSEADGGGCTVLVNSGIGEPRTFDSHGINDNPVPYVIDFNDASGDSLVTYRDQIEDGGSCGGLVDLTANDTEPEWTTCDFEPAQISPDSAHVIGLPAYYDGLGITEISVLDATTGEPTGARYAPERGFVSQWAWSTDGQVVFDAYDGARWHLFSMAADGELTEIGEPVKGDEFSPYTLIQH